MTVLVLGADGFLGRHVLQSVLSAGEEVVALVQDAGANGAARSETAVRRRAFDPLVVGPEGVAGLLEELRPRALINAAGATRGDLVQLVAANVALVATLVQGLASVEAGNFDRGEPRGSRCCRFVHIGSAAEYAAKGPGSATSPGDLAEPVSSYGATKLAGTNLVTIARARGQIEASVVRVFNPIGPHAPPVGLAGGAAASLEAAIARGERTLELGDLSAFRDFIDVRDAADLIARAALGEPPPPPVLNAGTGHSVPARELVRTLVRISGWAGEIRENGWGSPASAGVDWQQADISASVEALGWRPRRSLEESLADLWDSRG